MQLSENKSNVLKYMDKVAAERKRWIKKNNYYYQDLIQLLRFCIPEGARILEIGCGTGHLLHSLDPSYGVGIDFSERMIEIAKADYPKLIFHQMDAENLDLAEKFDFIIISDTLGYLEDIQKAFKCLAAVATPDTRIIMTYHNFLWSPFFSLAETMGLKMPRIKLNWLNQEDIKNLLYLEDFDLIKQGKRFIFPWKIPLLSWLLNKYIAQLPFFNNLCITGYIISRVLKPVPPDEKKVSVIIPARNEFGNIESAVLRLPKMGKSAEIIFVEGHSKDGTLAEIIRVSNKYSDKWDIKYLVQDGQGKAAAVCKGFAAATGDILMILDADLTVPPEDLPKFYNAISTGKGELINGSRLVYPMQKEAMRLLNVLGNKFFSVSFSWLLGQSLKDTLCGTKVLSRSNYNRLIRNRSYFGDFDPFGDFALIFGAAKLNLKIVEVPIRYKARAYGETQISRFKHGWLLLKMVFFAMNKIKFI